MNKTKDNHLSQTGSVLFSDIRQLIEESRRQVAYSVNATMSMLYWEIGGKINSELGKSKTKESYGQQIVENLCKGLSEEYGSSFSVKNVRRMMQFEKVFPEKKNVVSLIRQLSWTHILAVIPIEDPLKREFYIRMCIYEKWSVRTFRERIKSMLYERTAISRKPEETIKKDLKQLEDEQKINPDLVFRDPYFLDFLGLSDTYSEKDLENAILAELQKFIIELGGDFAFLSRQKRISIDNRDYYIDLLFYHRRLRSLIAIDLKIGEFDAAYKGEMELYLNYLKKYETVEGENTPVGLILCAGKNTEHIELMDFERSNIKVAEYLTILPSAEILKDRLHRAITIARNRLSK